MPFFGNFGKMNQYPVKMHLFSEPALWLTCSEFVDAAGGISPGNGETHIRFRDDDIVNESWVSLGGQTIGNNYVIHPSGDKLYHFESHNHSEGRQTGTFHIDRNVVYSRFTMDNSSKGGFEVVIRDGDRCEGYGALYEQGRLINTWRVVMEKF